jgi:hypothetical protein
MGDAAVKGEDAVEDEDAVNWEPRAAATAAMTTSRTATRSLRIRIRRVLVRARLLETTPPFKAAWCCEHVCRFRYADDIRQLVASEHACVAG